MKNPLDVQLTLFNASKTSKGYVFGKKEEYLPEHINSLEIFESWCLFIHHSVHKTRLVLLLEVTKFVSHKSDTILKPLLFGMGYIGDDLKEMMKYILWRATNRSQITTHLGHLSFECKLDGRPFTVMSTSHCRSQFNLGKLSSILTIYDNQGEGWSVVNTKRYFWLEDPWEDTSQQQPLMTTSHQFEENLILLCTMHEIKKVDPKKHSCRLFCIRCFLKYYDRRNTAI